jgi:hypothetical protein
LIQEFDGVQIETILIDLLLNSWSEVPAALTWATYDPTITWANAENTGLGEIDTGNYELAARSSDRTDMYSLVAALATSGLGYLYEDAQGRISYADSTHRSVYLATNGYTEISGSKALANGVRVQTRAGDVRNDITLKYGASSASETSATDTASIATYGRLAQIITTTIKHQADAEAQAAFYLTLRAQPQANFDAITFELTNSELTDVERDALINVFMGLPLRITDLPPNMASGQFIGFIEGWTWQAGFNQLSLTITASPVGYSLQAMKWSAVSGAETWSSITNTLEWQEALVVN